MCWAHSLLFLFCTVSVSRVVSQGDPIPVQTQTDTGTIEGYLQMAEGAQVEVYQGVPYAEPPIGDNRFKKPVKKQPWAGVLETKTPGFSCMQGNSGSPLFAGEVRWLVKTKQDEDCLTLNIWNPQNKPENASVMLFIHGGTFVRGASTVGMYSGATLAAFGRVIVVSINYRVGVFGFLNLGKASAPGNQALWDQKMAIEWVKDNIGYFGGNPLSITLFGHSAGAASVTAHLLSPESRTLFKRAIIQSASVNAAPLWLSQKKSRQYSWEFMKNVQCGKKNGRRKSIQCLKKHNSTYLAQIQMAQYIGTVLPFVPTVDGVFLPASPLTMLSEGDYGDHNILIGNVENEGSYLLPGDAQGIFSDTTAVPLPRFLLHILYDQLFALHPDDKTRIVKYEYTDWENDISFKNQLLLSDAFGDRLFVCPCVEFAKKFNKNANSVYFYYFTQRTSSLLWGDWMGVVHRGELEYVFGFPRDLNANYTAEERVLSATVMTYFTDFAKYGDPTPSTGTWPLYTEDNPEYVILNANEQGTGIGPRSKHCALWNWLLPSIEGEHKRSSKP